MTIFDRDTDRYLDRLGTVSASGDWNDVLARARGRARAARRARLAAGGGVAVMAAAVAFAAFGPAGRDSLLERAEAAVLAPVRASNGTIEHVLVQYRTQARDPFIEYETWIAADGAWCRQTVEGVPGQRVADTRLTLCRSSDGVVEVYLPARNEILRTRPGTPTGARSGRGSAAAPEPRKLRTRSGKLYLKLKPGSVPAREPADTTSAEFGPTPGWLTDDVIGDFRRHAVREAGTMMLDGHEYAKLVTEDGRNAVLVDRQTGEAVAWIPSPAAFGVATTVVRTRRTLPDDARSRRSLSLTELYPDAVVRDVSAAERDRAIAAQYPRG
jgi:hypothetical protein